MTTPKKVMKTIKDNDVKYVDFRFTDPRGKWQHVTFDVSMIEEDTFAEGQMFDGSSIAGGRRSTKPTCVDAGPAIGGASIRSSPRPRSSWCATCSSRHRRALWPRSALDRQEGRGMVKSLGIGDIVYFGPEAEFFVFDDVQVQG